MFFFFSSRRRHTSWNCDWSSDVCSSDLAVGTATPSPCERWPLSLSSWRNEDSPLLPPYTYKEVFLMQKRTTRPRHYSRAAAADTTAQNATTNNTGKKQKTSSWPDQTVFTPPIWMLFLGAIGFFAAFGANCWQVYTSFSAFQHMFITGSVYKAMSPGDQERSLTVVNLFSFIIAFSCQLALVFLIFRIERRWKEERAQGKSTSKVEAAKHTAVEVVNHIPLVVIWGVLGLVADTLGDVVFEGLYQGVTVNPG